MKQFSLSRRKMNRKLKQGTKFRFHLNHFTFKWNPLRVFANYFVQTQCFPEI